MQDPLRRPLVSAMLEQLSMEELQQVHRSYLKTTAWQNYKVLARY